MPIPKDAKLEGGSELSENALERLHQGVSSVNTDLPGRLLVVCAGTAVSEERGSEGEPLCPSSLVDKIFQSAAELHQACLGGVRLVTYALEASADPAFTPWSNMKQRLLSQKIIPPEDQGDDDDEEEQFSYHKKDVGKVPLIVRVSWRGGEELPSNRWAVDLDLRIQPAQVSHVSSARSAAFGKQGLCEPAPPALY